MVRGKSRVIRIRIFSGFKRASLGVMVLGTLGGPQCPYRLVGGGLQEGEKPELRRKTHPE